MISTEEIKGYVALVLREKLAGYVDSNVENSGHRIVVLDSTKDYISIGVAESLAELKPIEAYSDPTQIFHISLTVEEAYEK
jgi:hypothetical protein